ncbi:MAG: hypothetical protein Q8L14_20560 [Myxococcales bacterium]|nr:hypothetical protein [Myxococcales bacterium]
MLSTSCAERPAPQFEIVRPFSLQSCVRVFTTRSPTEVDVLIADRPVELEFQVTAFLECARGRVGLESISVTLVDDASEPIPARVEVLGFDPTVRTVKVSFVPFLTSAAQLRIVVEPSIGTFSQLLPVIQTSPRSWTDMPRRRCEGLLDGPGAEPLCVRNRSVEFANRSIPANAAAASPSMLWLFTSSSFDAWRFDGGEAGLVVSHPFTSRYPIAVAARAGRVVTALPDGVSVFDEDGGVRWAQIQPQSPSIQGLAFLDDETLLLARPGRTDRVPIAALDGVLTLPASEVTDVFVLTSAEGFWRFSFEPGSTLERFDGGRASMPARGLRQAVGLTMPDLVPLMSVGRAANTGLIGVPVPALDGGLALDIVEVPSGLTVQWLTSRWIFATRQSDGALVTAPRLP